MKADDHAAVDPNEFSSLPQKLAGPPDQFGAAALRHRRGGPTVDPRHLSLADPLSPGVPILPLPTASDRPLLGRCAPPLSEADAAQIFDAAGLPALAFLCRARLAMTVTEKKAAPFMLGCVVFLATSPALLAAIGLARPPGPAGPFATACAGILFALFVNFGTVPLAHHFVLAAPRFASPADPNLVGGYTSLLAWYCARTIGAKGGQDGPSPLLQHLPPPQDFASVEPLLVPEEVPTRPTSGSPSRSAACPCPACLGVFAGGGWRSVAAFFLLHYVLTAGILYAMVCLCFWDLWAGPGSPLYAHAWVAACFAAHCCALAVTIPVSPGRDSYVLLQANVRLIARVQLRAATAACGSFVRECAESLRRGRQTDGLHVVIEVETRAAEDPTDKSAARTVGSIPTAASEGRLPELYARVGSDIIEYSRDQIGNKGIYLKLPLALSLASLLAALVCSFPFGRSCFPAWGFAIPLYGLHMALINLGSMAIVNASAADVGGVYRAAAEALASLLADPRLDDAPGTLSAALAARMERHRVALGSIADALSRGTAKGKVLGFTVTAASLANLALAGLTVGATLFRAFGLRLQLGTYCT